MSFNKSVQLFTSETIGVDWTGVILCLCCPEITFESVVCYVSITCVCVFSMVTDHGNRMYLKLQYMGKWWGRGSYVCGDIRATGPTSS